MAEMANLQKIEARCAGIASSPYLFRELPPELRNLRAVLANVSLLVHQDVPALIAEVKRLRAENKRLDAAPDPVLSSESAAR